MSSPRAKAPSGRVVLSGYYGYGNLGDELILDVLVEGVLARGWTPVILSGAPELHRRRYGTGVVVAHRYRLTEVLRAIGGCEWFISGGGGLFQDATGLGSVLYYGALVLAARHVFNKSIALIGQGLGPLRKGISQRMVRAVLKACDVIRLRDSDSVALAQKLGAGHAQQAADLVWLWQGEGSQGSNKPGRQVDIAISLRPWQQAKLNEAFAERLARLVVVLGRRLSRPGNATPNIKLWLVPFQGETDKTVLNLLERTIYRIAQSKDGFDVPVGCYWSDDPVHTLGHCHAVIAMRFHACLLALRNGVPVLGLVYDPKVDALLERFAMPRFPLNAITQQPADVLAERTLEAWQQLPDTRAVLDTVAQEARLNLDWLPQRESATRPKQAGQMAPV